MAVTVRFVSVFRDLGVSRRLFVVEAETLEKTIDELEVQIPGLKEKLVDSHGDDPHFYQDSAQPSLIFLTQWLYRSSTSSRRQAHHG